MMQTLALLFLISLLSHEEYPIREGAQRYLEVAPFTVDDWKLVRGLEGLSYEQTSRVPRVLAVWNERLLFSLLPPGLLVWPDVDYANALARDKWKIEEDWFNETEPFGVPWRKCVDRFDYRGLDIALDHTTFSPYVWYRREMRLCTKRFLVESGDPERVRQWLADAVEKEKKMGPPVKLLNLFGIPLLYIENKFSGRGYAYAPDVLIPSQPR